MTALPAQPQKNLFWRIPGTVLLGLVVGALGAARRRVN